MTEKKSDDNIMAALAYLPILPVLLGLIMYLMYKEKSKYVSFHGLQSVFLSVCTLAVWIVVFIIGALLMFIPVVGWLIDIVLWLGMLVIVLGVFVFMMYKAYTGEKYKLPMIGDLAEKHV